jgi:hypothetical protein
MVQAVEHLLRKCKSLSSTAVPPEKKQNKTKTKTKQEGVLP